QVLDVLRVGLQEVEGDPLGTLGTDPGQSAELVDQVLDHTFVHASTLRPTGDAVGDAGPMGHSSRITVPPRSRSMTAGPAAPASTMSSSSSLTEASSGSWSTGPRSAGGDEGESAGRSCELAGSVVAHDGADEASVGAEPQSGPAPPPRAGATPTSAGGPSGGAGSELPVGAARGCSRGDGGAAPPAGADLACAPPPPGGGASP